MKTIERDGVTYAKLIDNNMANSHVFSVMSLEPETKYTVSLDVFSDSTSRFSVAVSDKRPVIRNTLIAKQNVQRKSFTFNTTDSTEYSFRVESETGRSPQTYVAHIKLEKGDKATAYTE